MKARFNWEKYVDIQQSSASDKEEHIKKLINIFNEYGRLDIALAKVSFTKQYVETNSNKTNFDWFNASALERKSSIAIKSEQAFNMRVYTPTLQVDTPNIRDMTWTVPEEGLGYFGLSGVNLILSI